MHKETSSQLVISHPINIHMFPRKSKFDFKIGFQLQLCKSVNYRLYYSYNHYVILSVIVKYKEKIASDTKIQHRDLYDLSTDHA